MNLYKLLRGLRIYLKKIRTKTLYLRFFAAFLMNIGSVRGAFLILIIKMQFFFLNIC